MTTNASQSVRWKQIALKFKEYRFILFLILPGLIYFAIFSYIPMYGVQLAFKEYIYSKGIWGSPFVGLQNFRYAMADQQFWLSWRNTIIISLCRLVFVFPVPIFLSLLLNELSSGAYKRVLQTIFTFPHFLSWIVIGGIMVNMFSSSGAVNNMIAALGGERVQFLAAPEKFRPTVYLTDIWKESGWSCIIYLAAITGISPEYYEAATVDGANRFHKILYITLPGIASTISVLLILSIGNIMNGGFDQIFNLYNPAVYETGDIIDTYIYRTTFQTGGDFGISTAVGLFKSVINLILLTTANMVSRRVSGSSLY